MQGQAEQAPHADSLCAPKAQISSQIRVWLTPSGSGTRRYFRPRSTKGSPFRLFRIAARSILSILSRLFFIGLPVLKVCAHICVSLGRLQHSPPRSEGARLNIQQRLSGHLSPLLPLGELRRGKHYFRYIAVIHQRTTAVTVLMPAGCPI